MSEFEDHTPLQASDTTSALDVRSCLSATLFHLITEPVMSLAPTECAAVTQLGSMQSHSRLSTLVLCPRSQLAYFTKKDFTGDYRCEIYGFSVSGRAD